MNGYDASEANPSADLKAIFKEISEKTDQLRTLIGEPVADPDADDVADLDSFFSSLAGGAPPIPGTAEGRDFIKTLGEKIASSVKGKLEPKEMAKAAAILQETLLKAFAKQGSDTAKSSAKFKKMALEEASKNATPYAMYGKDVVAIENMIKQDAKKEKSEKTRQLKRDFVKSIKIAIKLDQSGGNPHTRYPAQY